jgi:hypothetical protein
MGRWMWRYKRGGVVERVEGEGVMGRCEDKE